MREPIHRFKRYVVHKNEEMPPYWYETYIDGWLSTGVRDRNGTEIYEGHKVKLWLDKDYAIEGVVEFKDSAFKVEEWLLTDIESLDIEVVGHVAEDET